MFSCRLVFNSGFGNCYIWSRFTVANHSNLTQGRLWTGFWLLPIAQVDDQFLTGWGSCCQGMRTFMLVPGFATWTRPELLSRSFVLHLLMSECTGWCCFCTMFFFVAFVCNVLKTTGDKIICNDCSLLTLDFHCQILLVDVYLPCLALSDLLLVRQSKVQGACSQ